MENAKVIGVDFDDVTVDTNPAMARWHNRVYGTSYTKKDIYTYDLGKIWNCTPEEVVKRIREFYSSPEHQEIMPLEHAVESLLFLQHKETPIITARRQDYREITLALAQKHVPFLVDQFNFPNTNTSDRLNAHLNKAVACMELGVEVFIEDNLKYALDVALVGIPTFLMDEPWNQTNDLPHNVIRVGHWDEILEEFV